MKTKTNPFREFVKKLQQIRKEPLSKEQIGKINTILEKNNKNEDQKDAFEDEKRKIAGPSDSAQGRVGIQ